MKKGGSTAIEELMEAITREPETKKKPKEHTLRAGAARNRNGGVSDRGQGGRGRGRGGPGGLIRYGSVGSDIVFVRRLRALALWKG